MTAAEYHDRRSRMADAWARNRAKAAEAALWMCVRPDHKEKSARDYLFSVKAASEYQAIMQAEGIPFADSF